MAGGSGGAGLHYSVDSTTGGWQLTGGGYSHKLLHLVRLVLQRMVSLQVDSDRFQASLHRALPRLLPFHHPPCSVQITRT